MNSSVAIKEVSGGPNPAVAGWLTISLVTSLVIALYAEILADLAVEWWSVPSSSYGILIPPLAGYRLYEPSCSLRCPGHSGPARIVFDGFWLFLSDRWSSGGRIFSGAAVDRFADRGPGLDVLGVRKAPAVDVSLRPLVHHGASAGDSV